jgi:hypothetical protein
MEAYVHGVSTRAVDELVHALGIDMALACGSTTWKNTLGRHSSPRTPYVPALHCDGIARAV